MLVTRFSLESDYFRNVAGSASQPYLLNELKNSMIKVGDKIDLNFEVKAFVWGERWSGMFSELVTRPTVVSVYMRNNTSSCDRQTQQLREVAAELDGQGVGLIAVSRDTVGSHSKYACKLELPYALVSDPEYGFAAAVDSLVEKKLYGRVYTGPTRSAYLIGGDGVVLGVIEKVDSAGHADQVRDLANAPTS